MELVGNLVIVLLFAWVVRALLGARQVTWARLILAVVLGAALGATVAALLIIDLSVPLEESLARFEAERAPASGTEPTNP